MEQQNVGKRDNLDQGIAAALDQWRVESPGEGFFAALPALVQTHVRVRPWSAGFGSGLALSGLTAALATCVVVFGAWNIQRQQLFQERLITAAASWSTEQTSGAADLRDEDLSDQQDGAIDLPLDSAVERLTIEQKTGYQLLDDLNSDEIKQVVSALTVTRG